METKRAKMETDTIVSSTDDGKVDVAKSTTNSSPSFDQSGKLSADEVFSLFTRFSKPSKCMKSGKKTGGEKTGHHTVGINDTISILEPASSLSDKGFTSDSSESSESEAEENDADVADMVLTKSKVCPESGGIDGAISDVSETEVVIDEDLPVRKSGEKDSKHVVERATKRGIYHKYRIARATIRRVKARMLVECKMCVYRDGYKAYVATKHANDPEEYLALLPEHLRVFITHLLTDAECFNCDMREIIGTMACVDGIYSEAHIAMMDDVMDMKLFLHDHLGYDPIEH